MSASPQYQNFGGDASSGSIGFALDAASYEDEKLQSFEQGFQAGWDDAVKAQQSDKAHISSDLAKNLQDCSFGFHEARTALTKTLRPLFTQIVETVLPELARVSLGPKVVEQLVEMARLQSDQVIEITTAPENITAINSLLEDAVPEPFVLIADTTLGPGQVFLRIGSEEREMDMDQIIATTRDTMNALFQNGEQEKLNG